MKRVPVDWPDDPLNKIFRWYCQKTRSTLVARLNFIHIFQNLHSLFLRFSCSFVGLAFFLYLFILLHCSFFKSCQGKVLKIDTLDWDFVFCICILRTGWLVYLMPQSYFITHFDFWSLIMFIFILWVYFEAKKNYLLHVKCMRLFSFSFVFVLFFLLFSFLIF